MAKTWLADHLFPALYAYYRQAERFTGGRFFFPTPIYRAFVNVEEQNEWISLSADDAYRDYVSAVSTGLRFGDQVNDALGGITLKQCGYLNTGAYLQSVRAWLHGQDAFSEETFDPGNLEILDDFVRYEGRAGIVHARRIIFCQGVDNGSNPWFDYVPINALKGEFLTIQSQWENDVILNRGVYMVPGSGRGTWRVGATFWRDDRTREVTPRAKQELSRKLKDLIRTPFTVTDQQWGFRPTTPDRRPVLGAHPHHRALVIFNGLGTKGVSVAPYFSDVLIRWLSKEGTINKEADVSRF